MKGQKIGYIRVSSIDQKADRQLDGLELDRVFTDKASGRDTVRPQLQEMKRFVREGDTLVVHSMDRLARNLFDLLALVDELTKRGVNVQFIKEGLTFSLEDNHMGKLMLSIMGAVAEFERSLIRERQLEGIELAKKRQVYKGRKKSLTPSQVDDVERRLGQGETKAKIADELGVSRMTVYRHLKRPKLDNP